MQSTQLNFGTLPRMGFVELFGYHCHCVAVTDCTRLTMAPAKGSALPFVKNSIYSQIYFYSLTIPSFSFSTSL